MAKRSQPLVNVVVATIRHIERLQQFERQGYASFTENKRWVTAKKLVEAGERVPVILSDACATNRLLYWGWLASAEIDSGKTRIHLHGLRRIRGAHYRHELRRRDGNGRLSARDIKPYRLCRTPRFILNESQNPVT